MPHQCTNCGHTFADGSKEMLSGCPECGGNKFQFHPGEIPDDAEVDGDAEAPERPEAGGVSSAVGKAAATVRDFVSDDPDAGAPETAGPSEDTSAAESHHETTSASETEGSAAKSERADAEPAASADVTPDTDSPSAERDTRRADAATDSERVDAADLSSVDADTSADTDATADVGDDAEDAAQASARSEMVTSDDLPKEPPSDGRVVKEPDEDAEDPDMEALREELNDQFESIKVLAPGQYELNLMELYDREEYIIALQENGRYVIEVPETFAGPVADDE